MSTTAPPDPAALEAIFKKLEKDLDVSRVYFICCMSVLIWDWIVTFPSEYKYIWRTPWSIAKVLFLFNRYYTLAVMTWLQVLWWAPLPRSFCNKVFLTEPFLTTFVLVGCHLIFFLRTGALWSWNKYVVAVQVVILVFEIASEFASGAKNVLLPGQTIGCISGSGVSYIWLYWLGPLLFDTTTLALTAWRVYVCRKLAGGTNTPLLKQLLHDGLLYFIIVFVVNLLNEVFFLLPNPALQALHSGLAIVITSIMASRLMLKLRRFSQITADGSWTSWTNVGISTTRTGARSTNAMSGGGASGHRMKPLRNAKVGQTTFNNHIETVDVEGQRGISVVVEKRVVEDDLESGYEDGVGVSDAEDKREKGEFGS